MCGWQVKLCDPSITRAIPERFRDEYRTDYKVTYHVTYHVRPHQPIIDQQGLGLRGLVHN